MTYVGRKENGTTDALLSLFFRARRELAVWGLNSFVYNSCESFSGVGGGLRLEREPARQKKRGVLVAGRGNKSREGIECTILQTHVSKAVAFSLWEMYSIASSFES